MTTSKRDPETELKDCHNCRRRRLKCDRNVNGCLKCVQRGQECLGYQKLFRWGQGLASRGKLKGITFERLAEAKKQSHAPPQLPPAVDDPLFQDLCYTSRRYLSYFASVICRDLVLYDYSNPFRELIPLTQRYPCLLQIIVANSALHMCNASEKLLSVPSHTIDHRSSPPQLCPKSPPSSKENCYDIALAAKQKALVLLNLALGSMGLEDLDVILATVLLFVQFEIMDSAQDEWTHHIRGARYLIDMVYRSGSNAPESMSSLRRCLISNCLIYDIFGTTFTSPEDPVQSAASVISTLSLLQDAEGNHCSSFPTQLLHLIQSGARLSGVCIAAENHAARLAKEEQTYLLLDSARSFDPYLWATDVQTRSPCSDVAIRTHIASAHRAATCIYLQRTLNAQSTTTEVQQDIEALVLEVQTQLSNIPPNDSITPASAWPTFIAGAEAKDSAMEDWAQNQFQNIWAVQPWGLVKGALAVLRTIWAKRRQSVNVEGTNCPGDIEMDENWVTYMKRSGVNWLII